MFGSRLSERLNEVFRNLKGVGKISEKNVEEAVKKVQTALLEADVHYKIVKEFVSQVKEAALGEKVIKSVSPGQMFVKIVYDQLVELLGREAVSWSYKHPMPHRVMVLGLQGSGKTTQIAKLAHHLKKNDSQLKVLLASADVHRPAALEQLKVLAEKVGVDSMVPDPEGDLKHFVKEVRKKEDEYSLLILDTAGRQEVNEELMKECEELTSWFEPHSKFLVLDALTGQQSARVTQEFQKRIPLTGAILTKMDSDARGGAALSFRYLTGLPIYFYGYGEKIEDFDVFHPERIASRILGMGDVVSLVEKAQEKIDEEEARRFQKKLLEERFDFEDFLKQIEQMQKLGGLKEILSYLPGMSSMKGIEIDEKSLVRVKAIIQSMTKEERRKPHIINGSRRRRIAEGSGTTVQEVNQILKQYETMKKFIKQMKKGKLPLGNLWGGL